jgi:hypothetical protein
MGNPPKVKSGVQPDTLSFDFDDPLARIADESLRANTALGDYVFQGPGRSLRKLLKAYEKRGQSGGRSGAETDPETGFDGEPPTLRLSTLEAWSVKFHWQERLERWEYLRLQEKERKWAERREQQRDSEWETHNKLEALGLAWLAEAPGFTRTKRRIIKSTGQEIITVVPNHEAMLKTIELASKLGRLATGMETDRQQHEHSGPGGGPIPVTSELDLSDMDNEQLRDAVGKLGAIAVALAGGTFADGDILPGFGEDTAPEYPAGQDAGSADS